MINVRASVVAGAFYPRHPAELEHMIDMFLKDAKSSLKGIKAMIVPHAGYVYSGPVAAKGYNAIKAIKANKFIIVGPSHAIRFSGGAFDENTFWETPLGKVELSKFSSKRISINKLAHIHEHSIEVQLPFLQMIFKDFTICPISMGSEDGLLVDELASQLKPFTFLIVSSDLSHYLDYDEAVKKDKKTIQKIMEMNPSVNHEEACGAIGINLLIKIARKLDWKPQLLVYKNSGDTSGDKNRVVGYTCIAFTKKNG